MIHASLSTESLQRVARNTALVYHICITANRVEGEAVSPRRPSPVGEHYRQLVIQECDTWPGNQHP
jgi:hypothetical protein